MQQRSKHELRCFCSRAPLLAVYGVNDKGEAYLHVRISRQERVICELFMVGGTVQIHCRECLRWNTVRMGKNGPVLDQSEPPKELGAPHRSVAESFDARLVSTPE